MISASTRRVRRSIRNRCISPTSGSGRTSIFPEQPTTEELVALDPELHAALFGPPPRPFSITVVFPRFEGPDYDRAMTLARASREYREVGSGEAFRSRARFQPEDVLALRDLFEIVGRHDGTTVLVDDVPVPYARELWLPLLWYLLPR